MVYWAWFVLYILEYDLTYFYGPFSSFLFFHKEKTKILSQCGVTLCVCAVCQANTQQPQDLSLSLLVYDFHFIVICLCLRLCLNYLFFLLHSLPREGKGQRRHDFVFLPLPFLVCFTYRGTQFLSFRSCVTEGKKSPTVPQPPPPLPSILHTVDQTDSASLKVIVAGVIPLGWMCMVCTFCLPLQELTTTTTRTK